MIRRRSTVTTVFELKMKDATASPSKTFALGGVDTWMAQITEKKVVSLSGPIPARREDGIVAIGLCYEGLPGKYS